MDEVRKDSSLTRTIREAVEMRAGMPDEPFSSSNPLTEIDKIQAGIPLSRADRKAWLSLLPGGDGGAR
jgi:gluconate kinase